MGALAGQVARGGRRSRPCRRAPRPARPRPASGAASWATTVDLGVDVERVVGADLGAEAVLERGDDPAPVGVVLGVGRGDQHDVEGQADLVAPDLDVALLEHVEQADLDALGQVGQLVDGEDAPVGAGHQAVVQGQLVGQVAALGHLDGVDLADQVGDRRVGRGQLLAEAVVAVHPGRSGCRRPRSATRSRAWRDTGWYGIVEDLGAGHDGQPLVEQVGQRADHAGLGLAPLAQEDDVVAGQQGVLELGQHRVLVAQHPREQGGPTADATDGVGPDLFLDGTGDPARLAELAEREHLWMSSHGPRLPSPSAPGPLVADHGRPAIGDGPAAGVSRWSPAREGRR